jgi:carbamoyl-phosphate synthase large subunit
VNYAVMLGHNKVTDFKFNPQLKGYAIKQPVFSFSKFHNVNKALGPEMKSTGESIFLLMTWINFTSCTREENVFE